MASTILSGLAGKALEVVAGPLCLQCIDEFQNSIQVLYKPEILDEYVRTLGAMDNQIKAMSCTGEINNWIAEADRIIRQYRSSNRTDDQRFCCFSSNACLRYKLQKKIKKLMDQGKRIITCDDLRPKSVEKIHYGVPPIGNDTTAGRNLKRVMDMLEDDAVWTIGLWGPGGVGKTTLARALNNELEKTSTFSMVIYVEITKDVDSKGMQKGIAQRLGQNVEEGMDTGHVAERIRNRLQKEKFLLIVDNVWEHIDLPSIGIPQKHAGSKVVLTTRILEVCDEMEAKPLQIGYLSDEEAWQLFAEKAGDVVDREEIKPLAKTVCQECGRLPLALIAVGSAMRRKMDCHLWQSAIDKLKQAKPISSNIESQVYNALMLSYDRLENDTLRFCFLYCSLYPEGYRINVNELVECWLAEKKIDEQLYYENAFREGLDLIGKLTSSCLLEKGAWPESFDGSYQVKMHDVVSDFARWIAEQNRCMIFSGHGISKVPGVQFQEVNNLEWISFVDNKEIELPRHRKDFPKVTTLLLHGTDEHEVQLPHEFLEGFQKLRVLNMQYVQSFPGSSLCPAELRAFILRYCYHVEEIPCMPKLIILDLSGCDLDKIPRGLRESTHLKVLNLSETFNLKSVEADIISNLTSLEVLDTRGSGYRWPTSKRKSKSKDEATLQDLSELKELKSVYLDLADVECSYEDCKWMERLQNFYYDYNASIKFLERTGRDIRIRNEKGKDVEVGSFVLHAESLLLENVQNANEIFLNHVEEIPCMPKLIMLDLSGSTLDKTPRGLWEFTHLKVLILWKTFNLKSVEVDIISKFSSLEVLDTRGSGYEWPTSKRKSKSKDEATLQDLSELKELKSVYLELADVECSYEDCKWMERLQNFDFSYGYSWTNEERTGRDIRIGWDERGKDVGSFVLHAESLQLCDIREVNEIFVNSNSTSQSNSKLKRLEMYNCTFSGKSTGPAPNCIALSNLETLRHVSLFDKDVLSFSQIANALGATFPKLEEIILRYGENMREVFHHGPTKDHVVAPNLRIMTIHSLPNLERLCDYELTEQWRSLEVLCVEGCPKLKKLPHMPSIKEIRGKEEWWNNLEWDSSEAKSYMDRFFKPPRGWAP